MAANCTLTSIYNDIHMRPINDSPSGSHQYGLRMGFGHLSQNTSFWPSIIQNETYFRSTAFCTVSASSQCISGQNGEINLEFSSSWRNDSSYNSTDDSSLRANATARYGWDTISLWTHYVEPSPLYGTYLPEMPLTIVSNTTGQVDLFSGPGNIVGLGPGSTVLDHLYKQKMISSRSYGLYVGTAIPAIGGSQNGSLTLGGYDAARFTGPVYTYTQSPPSPPNRFSPFQIKVSQVVLEIAPGDAVELTENAGFDAYLTTSQYPLQLPRSVTQKLATRLSATTNDDTLRVPNSFTGNLTFTLNNGLKVTFDSTWLSNTSNVSPISTAPLQSKLLNSTSSNSTLKLDSSPAILGIAFLQQLYLLVSHDNTPPTFSLAQATLDTKYVEQEPLCPGTIPKPATAPNISKFVQLGMIGAVLGGTIGGVALLCLLAVCLKYSLRKRLIAKAARARRSDQEFKPPGKAQGPFRNGLKAMKWRKRKPETSTPVGSPPTQYHHQPQQVQFAPTPYPMQPSKPEQKQFDVDQRSDSMTSTLSCHTKTSTSSAAVTVTELSRDRSSDNGRDQYKDIEMEARPRPPETAPASVPLDFGFHDRNGSPGFYTQGNRYTGNTYAYPAPLDRTRERAAQRSSSIYSTD